MLAVPLDKKKAYKRIPVGCERLLRSECNRDNQSTTYLFGSIQIRCVLSGHSKKWVEIKNHVRPRSYF